MSTDRERRPFLYGKLPAQRGNPRVSPNREIPSDIASVYAVGSALSTDSERVCESPFCSVRFEQSGMEISPKRFCSDACKMDAWALRRVRKLLEEVSDQTALEILRRKP